MVVSLPLIVISACIVFILLFVLWLQRRGSTVSRQTIYSILEAAAIPAYRQSLPQLRKEISRARRYQRPLAIVVIQINPTFSREHKGRVNEDSVVHANQARELQPLEFVLCGSIFRDALRDSDITTYDGVKKQFVIFLPECTQKDTMHIVERLRNVVGKNIADNLSTGIVEFPDDGLIIEDLVNRAMERLNRQPTTALLDGKKKRSGLVRRK